MKKLYPVIAAVLMLLTTAGGANADDGMGARLAALEAQVSALASELAAARVELDEAKNQRTEEEAAKVAYTPSSVNGKGVLDRFSLGGYGEMHANFTEGGGPDIFDIHRLVLNIGYDFSDWIKLGSEIEVEHAFVSGGSGGELSIEQLYVDFLLHDAVNVRAGRVLAPLGITNQRHEPPSFNGVERPSFDKYIIPTTWSMDGLGAYGNITDNLKYQVYAVAGLDGSKFNAKDGIREGRIKERASFNDLAITGRLDWLPLINTDLPVFQDTRLGASFYYGGINNGNNGKDPGTDGSVAIYSGDFETTAGDLDFRGAVAYTAIDGAEKLPGVAEGIFGYYVEAGYHFWPEAFKTGRLERSDAVIFARYDDYDTQYKMPAGVAKNPAGDRDELTFGINFYPVPNLVIKADYQIRDSKAAGGLSDMINFGIGFQL